MTTAKPLPSMEMFVRVMVAAALSLAPTRVVAAGPGSSELARQAARSAARAIGAADPEAAVVAAFEAHNLWSQAFQADGEEVHLCKARSLLVKICARPDLQPEYRASLERNRDALPRCPRPRRSEKSNGQAAKVSDRAPPPRFLDVPHPAGDPDRAAEPPDTEQVPDARAPAPLPQVRSAAGVEPLDRHEDPERALRISGGASIALGILALGVMTPFAVRDAANAKELRELATANDAAGGLTPAQDLRVAELAEESRLTFRSSLALGLTGGVATLLGVGLLLAGHRRSTAQLSLSPSADRNSASLSLQGRF